MNDKQITELEIKIAYQEDLLEALNSIVIEHQKQISRLEETCKLLNEKIKNTSGVQEINQGVEKPPHY
jgi:SlyX protein